MGSGNDSILDMYLYETNTLLVQNVPDPTRVTRPDNRTEQQDTGDAAGGNQALRYDSNFASFRTDSEPPEEYASRKTLNSAPLKRLPLAS